MQILPDRRTRVRRALRLGRRLPRREAMRARAAMARAAQDDVP